MDLRTVQARSLREPPSVCRLSLSLSAACCFLITSCCTHPHSAAFSLSLFFFFNHAFPKTTIFAVSFFSQTRKHCNWWSGSVIHPTVFNGFYFSIFFLVLGRTCGCRAIRKQRVNIRVSERHTGLFRSPDCKNKALDFECPPACVFGVTPLFIAQMTSLHHLKHNLEYLYRDLQAPDTSRILSKEVLIKAARAKWS